MWPTSYSRCWSRCLSHVRRIVSDDVLRSDVKTVQYTAYCAASKHIKSASPKVMSLHLISFTCISGNTAHVTVGAWSKSAIGLAATNYYAALLPRRGPHIASHSVCPSVCLSVCPSVPLSLPSVTWRHLANCNDTHVLFGTRWGPHIVRPSRPHKFLFSMC